MTLSAAAVGTPGYMAPEQARRGPSRRPCRHLLAGVYALLPGGRPASF